MNRRLFMRAVGAAAFGTGPLRGKAQVNGQQFAGSSLRQTSTSRRLVTIEANPAPISIDLARTAILVVDMQNDF